MPSAPAVPYRTCRSVCARQRAAGAALPSPSPERRIDTPADNTGVVRVRGGST